MFPLFLKTLGRPIEWFVWDIRYMGTVFLRAELHPHERSRIYLRVSCDKLASYHNCIELSKDVQKVIEGALEGRGWKWSGQQRIIPTRLLFGMFYDISSVSASFKFTVEDEEMNYGTIMGFLAEVARKAKELADAYLGEARHTPSRLVAEA